MVTAGRRESSPLEMLYLQPEKFNFFQGVRLLERDMLLKRKFSLFSEPSLLSTGLSTNSSSSLISDFSSNSFLSSSFNDCSCVPCGFVGTDAFPRSESIRFCAFPATSFPISSITNVKMLKKENVGSDKVKIILSEMQVSFMGLTGANGILPQHYTELLLQRIYLNDFTLRDFLDLFNHRLVSLFYKAWEKNKFYIGYEKAKIISGKYSKKKKEKEEKNKKNADRFSSILSCLWGTGFSNLKERLEISDEALSYYTGTLSKQIHSAKALEGMLADYLELPIVIDQFQGKREKLQEDDCSLLASKGTAEESYNELGVNFVLGNYIWNINSKFRVKIGPLTYEEFKSLLPGNSKLSILCQIIRFYVGLEFEFDLQLILKKEEIPKCQLGCNKGDNGSTHMNQLGWTTWLKIKPFLNNSNDVVLAERVKMIN